VRKVYIADSACVDDRLMQVADVNPTAALVWPWFLLSLDDWGRGTAHPRQLRARLFPENPAVTVEIIDEALHLYAAAGLVVLYEVDDRPFVAIPAEEWFGVQTHIRREKRTNDGSRYPAPPDPAARTCAQSRADARSSPQCCASPSPSTLPPFHPSKDPLPKASRLSAPGDEDWSKRASAILADTQFRPEFERLAELLAEANKTGTVTVRRVVRELYEPLAKLEAETDPAALRYGLEAAIAAGAANARYVAKAAAGYRANSKAALAPTSRLGDLGDYDRDFLTEG